MNKLDWMNQYAELHSIYGTFSPGNYVGATYSGFENVNLFPIAMKVASATVGLDLVAVQPISMPVGKLFYMNMDSIRDKRKKAIEELFRQMPQ